MKVYGLCLMANHLHLLVKPEDANDLPRVMHWFAWDSAMTPRSAALPPSS
ncbi:MAG: transposase [Prochlorococcus sp.]